MYTDSVLYSRSRQTQNKTHYCPQGDHDYMCQYCLRRHISCLIHATPSYRCKWKSMGAIHPISDAAPLQSSVLSFLWIIELIRLRCSSIELLEFPFSSIQCRLVHAMTRVTWRSSCSCVGSAWEQESRFSRVLAQV